MAARRATGSHPSLRAAAEGGAEEAEEGGGSSEEPFLPVLLPLPDAASGAPYRVTARRRRVQPPWPTWRSCSVATPTRRPSRKVRPLAVVYRASRPRAPTQSRAERRASVGLPSGGGGGGVQPAGSMLFTGEKWLQAS